jgi:hypothetical protein
MRVRALAIALLCGAALPAAACKNRNTVATHLPREEPPRRAANSFVHCVESETSLCIKPGETVGGWDAFYLLMWLAGGSPVSILAALPSELAGHADPLRVQRRFVNEVERYAQALRGAACMASDMRPVDPLVDQVAGLAEQRLQRLGVWRGDMAEVVRGLVTEAHETLGGGYLVQVDCEHDPHRLWVATVERDGQHRVVGMTTILPTFLGGTTPGRDQVTQRLRSRSLGLSTSAPLEGDNVHPWIAFPVEVF